MRTLLCATSLLALLAVGPAATAQPPGGGMFRNQAMLLMQESVRKELKLSDEQAKKVEEVGASMREKMMDIFQNSEGDDRRTKMQELMKETEKTIGEILKADQTKRLKQIGYQLAGAQAFGDPELAKTLKITDEQKKDIQTINMETMAAMRELFQGGGGPPDEETMKKMQELRKGAVEKVVKLFNDDQKKSWKDLQGEPFKGEIRFGPPR
jgi:hypothetical protein